MYGNYGIMTFVYLIIKHLQNDLDQCLVSDIISMYDPCV